MENFYKSYIASQTLQAVPSRDQILAAKIADQKEDAYWIEVYMRIRQSEVSDKLSKSDFNMKLREAKLYNLDRAATFINNNFLGKLRPDFAE